MVSLMDMLRLRFGIEWLTIPRPGLAQVRGRLWAKGYRWWGECGGGIGGGRIILCHFFGSCTSF